MSEQKASEPAAVSRPVIDPEAVKLLTERLYGLTVQELTELPGYDERNYKIMEDPNMKNPLIPNHCEYGYVLNIMNAVDSLNGNVVEAQNEIMNFLNTRSIVCPKPIRNVYGHLYSVETLGGNKHAVRLAEYVPGEMMCEVPRSEALFYQLGEFVANLDSKLQNFNHSGLASREHIWMLTKVPELEKFKDVITDADQLDLLEEVIEEFKYAVVPSLEELERGVIHGDIDDTNVVVCLKPGGSKTDYRVSGVLDFRHVQYSYYVFEVATAMASMMLLSGEPRTGGIVLAGYTVTRRLPDNEYRLLKTLVSARLVQNLVLGAYTAQQDPKNAAKSTEMDKGWELLRKIRKTKPSPEGDPTDWKTIANEYLTRS